MDQLEGSEEVNTDYDSHVKDKETEWVDNVSAIAKGIEERRL